ATTTIGSTTFETTPVATLAVYEGILNCGASLALDATNPYAVPQSAPGWAGGYRGASNAKGSDCVLVNYTVNNTILADNTIALAWDTTAQPEAAFALSANFKPEDVDADGWPNNLKRPQMAWKFDTGGAPIYIKGIACVAPVAPVSYGTLTSPVSSGTSLSVTLSSTPAPPPPFEIAIDGERMTVISTGTGTNWTVASTIQGSHAAGAFVESRYAGLPEQYGTVTTIAPSSTSATCTSNCATLDLVRTRDFPPAPFPIQIGAERLLVTKILSGAPNAQVEVVRQHGGTPSAAAASMKVMSTPLPLIPSGAIPSGVTAYQAGKPAQMCIVTFGWTAVGMNSATSPPESARQQVMPFVEWYDIGDGWISVR
ncbi:MAG TPA: hypothetical protein VFX05_01540, partial [Casimicrobiaceae bacterium]|nr:hypothetical protein [Casimicrobiaceae bacterium]